MSLRTQWPYAALAIVQHEWVTNLLNMWVTFKFPMDQTVKPANGLWLVEVDDVLKAVTVSAWQDEWTILLTIPNVLTFPDRVTLEYDGPDENLRITWGKQWEPWGPILSLKVPYPWEGVLVVDVTNKKVGVQPGTAYAGTFPFDFTVVSPDGTETVGFYHDNTNAYFQWSQGALIIQTSKPNTNSGITLRGNGTGYGYFNAFDEDNQESTWMSCISGHGYVECVGAGAVRLVFQRDAAVPVLLFRNCTEGETQIVEVAGFRAGDQRRWLKFGCGVDAPNTASFFGLDAYWFDGDLDVEGAISSGTLTHAVVGPTDDLDVSGVNTLFLDCSANDVTIGGFVGGVDGQVLHIARLCAAANDATLEHNEGTGNQDIFLHAGADETLTGEYGGWTLVCDGSNWYDISHAKHV